MEGDAVTDAPYISIIIALKDAADALRVSLRNIEKQTFTRLEIIVADANSTDNPADAIASYSGHITHKVQSDEGIYDAWNKVIPFIKGDWIVFFGAGDEFSSSTALEEMVAALKLVPPDVNMAYGRVEVIGESGKQLRLVGNDWAAMLRQIKNFDMFPHQATFQRLTSFERHGYFNKAYTIAGDTDMILRLAAIAAPVFVDVTVSRFHYGGVSSNVKTRLKAIQQHKTVLEAHGIHANARLSIAKYQVLSLLTKVLPESAFHAAIDAYRRLTGRRPRYR